VKLENADLDRLRKLVTQFFGTLPSPNTFTSEMWRIWFECLDELAGNNWSGLRARDYYQEIFLEMISNNHNYWTAKPKNNEFIGSEKIDEMAKLIEKTFASFGLNNLGREVAFRRHPGLLFLNALLRSNFMDENKNNHVKLFRVQFAELVSAELQEFKAISAYDRASVALFAQQLGFEIDKKRSGKEVLGLKKKVSNTCLAIISISQFKNAIEPSTRCELGFCHPDANVGSLVMIHDNKCEIQFPSFDFRPFTFAYFGSGFANHVTKEQVEFARVVDYLTQVKSVFFQD
jgi:hypothetical protein